MENLEKITTEMMEYICDSLCKYSEMESGEEALEERCADCKMGKFICDILNQENGRTNEGRNHEQE